MAHIRCDGCHTRLETDADLFDQCFSCKGLFCEDCTVLVVAEFGLEPSLRKEGSGTHLRFITTHKQDVWVCKQCLEKNETRFQISPNF